MNNNFSLLTVMPLWLILACTIGISVPCFSNTIIFFLNNLIELLLSKLFKSLVIAYYTPSVYFDFAFSVEHIFMCRWILKESELSRRPWTDKIWEMSFFYGHYNLWLPLNICTIFSDSFIELVLLKILRTYCGIF